MLTQPSLAALSQVLPGLFGKQMGAQAPAPMLGGTQAGVAGSGGLLGPQDSGPTPVADAIQSTAPVTSMPSVFNAEQQNAAMQQPAQQEQGGFGSFLSGIDKGLQSPSQLLGLGLLSQLGGNSNLLPIGGLLGMGLLNRNK